MEFTDHLGRSVAAPDSPERIISLCPSQTETLFTLGMGDKVVGATQWCIHPQAIKAVPKVGGTKKVNFRKVAELKPDLIIAEKEEQTPEMIAELEQHYPVYVTDIQSIDDALNMVADLGTLVGKAGEGADLAADIADAWDALPKLNEPKSVAYFIWKDPYMVVGQPTYIQDVLLKLGFHNVFAHRMDSRYPQVEPDQLQEANPEYIFLSSEPYSFDESHIPALQEIVPEAKIMVVDGEMFSWYGSRMLLAAAYCTQLVEKLAS